MQQGSDSKGPDRKCSVCGGLTRFRHEEYVRGGGRRLTYRCGSCGNLDVGPTLTEPRQRDSVRSKKHKPVNDGSPDNFVVDESTADQLRRLLNPEQEP